LTHLIGKQLGRYTIQEEIGRGGMARVYRAQDTQLKRTVAIKVLLPQLAVDPEFAQRFEREAVTAANLRHANIVTIYDVGEQDGLRYIAMEYVRGRTLHAIIDERGALGLGYALTIVGPVAAALDYAHRQGAVHRDIKPQNIMIDVDGRVLLTDFGIAQPPESGSGERLTRTGIFMGTPEYISPEQASAQRVDGRSDLYSLGIATYEVITGNVPFSGATPQLIVAHAQKPPPPITTQDSDLPLELDRVMARILAKRPDQRYASGAEFIDDLRGVVRSYGIAVATPRQLAGLVPAPSTDTTVARQPAPAPPLASPPAAPRVGSSDPTQVGPTPRPAVPTMPSRSRPAVLPPVLPSEEQYDQLDDLPQRAPPARRALPPEPPDDGGGGRRGALVIGGLFGGLLLVVLFVIVSRGFPGSGTNVTPTRPSVPSPLPTVVPASPTPLPTATATSAPTVVPAPTEAPVIQPIEATPVPAQPPPPQPSAEPPIEPSPAPVEPSPTAEPPADTPTTPPAETPSPVVEPPTSAPTSPPGAPTAEPGTPSPDATAAATVSPAPTAAGAATAAASATVAATTTSATAAQTLVATSEPTPSPTAEPPTPTNTAPSPTAPPTAEPPTKTPAP
jgi:serine/threonine-protein kinase